MKSVKLLIAGLGLAAAVLPAAASAQPWAAGDRTARIEARIDQGVRSGALDRSEARRLRVELRGIERLQDRYARSRPGLTVAERADISRRLDALQSRVFVEKHDSDRRPSHHW